MARDRANDPQVLACLGRVWLLKGKLDKSSQAMKSSLDYSTRALAIAPSQIHFKFNIAFVQIQIAQLIHSLPESQRTLAEVQTASEGLEAAIESFTQIAHSKNPPYPKHDIEQRANMGRNTMRHQLERAVQSQRRYEETNAAKLQDARSAREAEMKKREEERRIAAELAEEEMRKLAEKRLEMAQFDRELAEKRAEEERRKEEAEYTEIEETGERVKRKKLKRGGGGGGGKRRKKAEDSDSDGGEAGEKPKKRRGKSTEDDGTVMEGSGDDAVAARPPKRRRKLARKGQNDGFKSTELVVESDSDMDDLAAVGEDGSKGDGVVNGTANGTKERDEDEDEDVNMDDTKADEDEDDEEEEEEEEEVALTTHRSRTKPSRRIQDDDDEEEEEDEKEKEEDKEEEEDMDIDHPAQQSSSSAPAPASSKTQNDKPPPNSGSESESEDPQRKRNVFADLPNPPVEEGVAAAGAA